MTTQMRAEFKMLFIHKAGTFKNLFLAWGTVGWTHILFGELPSQKHVLLMFHPSDI